MGRISAYKLGFILLIAGYLLSACGSGNADHADDTSSPATVCVSFQDAMRVGNKAKMMGLATVTAWQDIQATPSSAIGLAGRAQPESVVVKNTDIGADKITARVALEAPDAPLPYGRCDLARENGTWKVQQIKWSKQNPQYQQVADDTVDVVYQKLHRAILESFSTPTIVELFSAASKAKLDQNHSQLDINLLSLRNGAMPKTYSVNSDIQYDRATLKLSGMIGDLIAQDGTVVLVKEDSVWKVESLVWGKVQIP